MMKEQDTTNDDDFVKYIKTGKTKSDEHYCCTWKACWISTCATWALTSIATAITFGVLIGQHYIKVSFQDPHHPGNNTITF